MRDVVNSWDAQKYCIYQNFSTATHMESCKISKRVVEYLKELQNKFDSVGFQRIGNCICVCQGFTLAEYAYENKFMKHVTYVAWVVYLHIYIIYVHCIWITNVLVSSQRYWQRLYNWWEYFLHYLFH